MTFFLKLRRGIALFTLISFCVTTGVSDASIVTEVKDASGAVIASFSIPQELGQVAEVFDPPKTIFSPVIHIQDAHSNYSAQKSISGLIEYFSKREKDVLVLMEGVFGTIDTRLIQAIPDENLKKNGAERLLKKGLISGPEFFQVTSSERGRAMLKGIEDKGPYLKNYQAFLVLEELKLKIAPELKLINTYLGNIQNRIYPKQLRELDRYRERFGAGAMDLAHYLTKLTSSSKSDIDWTKMSQIHRLMEFLAKKQAAPAEVARLTAELDGSEVFRELSLLETQVRGAYFADQDQRELDRALFQFQLLKRGLALELVPEEVNQLKFPEDWMDAVKLREFVDRLLGRQDWPERSLTREGTRAVLDFYQWAEARDARLYENIRTALKSHSASQVIVVTGGYHTKGLDALFRKDLVGFRTISPRIERIDLAQTQVLYLDNMREWKFLSGSPSPSLSHEGRGTEIPSPLTGEGRGEGDVNTTAVLKAFDLGNESAQLLPMEERAKAAGKRLAEVYQRPLTREDMGAIGVNYSKAISGLSESERKDRIAFFDEIERNVKSAVPLSAQSLGNVFIDVYDPKEYAIQLLANDQPSGHYRYDHLTRTSSWDSDDNLVPVDFDNNAPGVPPIRLPAEELERRVIWELGERRDRLTTYSYNNLYSNDWFIAFDGEAQQLYHARGEPYEKRHYSMFVVWKDGRVSSEDLHFLRGHDGNREKYQIFRALDLELTDDISDEIKFAVFGQRLIHKAEETPLSELAAQFSDLFHLYRLPQFIDPAKKGLQAYGEVIGLHQINQGPIHPVIPEDREVLKNILARNGYAEIDLAPYLTRYSLEDIKRKAFAIHGYKEIFTKVRKPEDLQVNQYFIKGNTLHVRLRPFPYPHNLLGITASGKVLGIVLTGDKTKEIGFTLPGVQRVIMEKQKRAEDPVRELFLLANSRDAYKRVGGAYRASESSDNPYETATALVGFLHRTSGQSLGVQERFQGSWLTKDGRTVYQTRTGLTLAGFNKVSADVFQAQNSSLTVKVVSVKEPPFKVFSKAGQLVRHEEADIVIAGAASGQTVSIPNVQYLGSQKDGSLLVNHFKDNRSQGVVRSRVTPSGQVVTFTNILSEARAAASALEKAAAKGDPRITVRKRNFDSKYLYDSIVLISASFFSKLPTVSIYKGMEEYGKFRFFTSGGELLEVDSEGRLTVISAFKQEAQDAAQGRSLGFLKSVSEADAQELADQIGNQWALNGKGDLLERFQLPLYRYLIGEKGLQETVREVRGKSGFPMPKDSLAAFLAAVKTAEAYDLGADSRDFLLRFLSTWMKDEEVGLYVNSFVGGLGFQQDKKFVRFVQETFQSARQELSPVLSSYPYDYPQEISEGAEGQRYFNYDRLARFYLKNKQFQRLVFRRANPALTPPEKTVLRHHVLKSKREAKSLDQIHQETGLPRVDLPADLNYALRKTAHEAALNSKLFKYKLDPKRLQRESVLKLGPFTGFGTMFVLEELGVTTVAQLIEKTPAEIYEKGMWSFQHLPVEELRQKLAEHGLALKGESTRPRGGGKISGRSSSPGQDAQGRLTDTTSPESKTQGKSLGSEPGKDDRLAEQGKLRIDLSDKFVLLLPGQGVQKVGMGQDMYDRYSEYREVYERTNQVLKSMEFDLDLVDLMFHGPQEKLDRTEFAQVAVTTMNYAAYEVLRTRLGKDLKVGALIGNSTGMLAALMISGAISFEDGIKLAMARGKFSQKVEDEKQGKMASISGLSRKAVEDLARIHGVQVSNVFGRNARSGIETIFISGYSSRVDKVVEETKGMRGVTTHQVLMKYAAHSELMKPAAEELEKFLENIKIRAPAIPVVGNVTGDYLVSAEDVKKELIEDMTHPVLWEASVKTTAKNRAAQFLEIGTFESPFHLNYVPNAFGARRTTKQYVRGVPAMEALIREFKSGGRLEEDKGASGKSSSPGQDVQGKSLGRGEALKAAAALAKTAAMSLALLPLQVITHEAGHLLTHYSLWKNAKGTIEIFPKGGGIAYYVLDQEGSRNALGRLLGEDGSFAALYAGGEIFAILVFLALFKLPELILRSFGRPNKFFTALSNFSLAFIFGSTALRAFYALTYGQGRPDWGQVALHLSLPSFVPAAVMLLITAPLTYYFFRSYRANKTRLAQWQELEKRLNDFSDDERKQLTDKIDAILRILAKGKVDVSGLMTEVLPALIDSYLNFKEINGILSAFRSDLEEDLSGKKVQNPSDTLLSSMIPVMAQRIVAERASKGEPEDYFELSLPKVEKELNYDQYQGLLDEALKVTGKQSLVQMMEPFSEKEVKEFSREFFRLFKDRYPRQFRIVKRWMRSQTLADLEGRGPAESPDAAGKSSSPGQDAQGKSLGGEPALSGAEGAGKDVRPAGNEVLLVFKNPSFRFVPSDDKTVDGIQIGLHRDAWNLRRASIRVQVYRQPVLKEETFLSTVSRLPAGIKTIRPSVREGGVILERGFAQSIIVGDSAKQDENHILTVVEISDDQIVLKMKRPLRTSPGQSAEGKSLGSWSGLEDITAQNIESFKQQLRTGNKGPLLIPRNWQQIAKLAADLKGTKNTAALQSILEVMKIFIESKRTDYGTSENLSVLLGFLAEADDSVRDRALRIINFLANWDDYARGRNPFSQGNLEDLKRSLKYEFTPLRLRDKLYALIDFIKAAEPQIRVQALLALDEYIKSESVRTDPPTQKLIFEVFQYTLPDYMKDPDAKVAEAARLTEKTLKSVSGKSLGGEAGKDVRPEEWRFIKELDGKIRIHLATGQITFSGEEPLAALEADEFYMVRHGKTSANQQDRFQGALDERMNQLTLEGERGAEDAAQKLFQHLEKDLRSGAVLVVAASKLNRSIVTADFFDSIARTIPGIDLIRRNDVPLLMEIAFGRWDNKTADEIEKGYGPAELGLAKRYRYLSDAAVRPIGGESAVDVMIRTYKEMERFNQELREIKAAHPGKKVILAGFVHGTQSALMRALLGDKGVLDKSGSFINWRDNILPNTTPVYFDPKTRHIQIMASPAQGRSTNTTSPGQNAQGKSLGMGGVGLQTSDLRLDAKLGKNGGKTNGNGAYVFDDGAGQLRTRSFQLLLIRSLKWIAQTLPAPLLESGYTRIANEVKSNRAMKSTTFEETENSLNNWVASAAANSSWANVIALFATNSQRPRWRVKSLFPLMPQAITVINNNQEIYNKSQIMLAQGKSPDITSPGQNAQGRSLGQELDPLITALSNENPKVREDAARSIGRIGPGASKAVPALIKTLVDENHFTREAAAVALGNIGPGASAAAVPLTLRLDLRREHNVFVRRSAAIALGQIGSDVREAIVALLRALSDPNAYVRIAAADALANIPASWPAARERLTERLANPALFADVRQAFEQALEKMTPPSDAGRSPSAALTQGKPTDTTSPEPKAQGRSLGDETGDDARLAEKRDALISLVDSLNQYYFQPQDLSLVVIAKFSSVIGMNIYQHMIRVAETFDNPYKRDQEARIRQALISVNENIWPLGLNIQFDPESSEAFSLIPLASGESSSPGQDAQGRSLGSEGARGDRARPLSEDQRNSLAIAVDILNDIYHNPRGAGFTHAMSWGERVGHDFVFRMIDLIEIMNNPKRGETSEIETALRRVNQTLKPYRTQILFRPAEKQVFSISERIPVLRNFKYDEAAGLLAPLVKEMWNLDSQKDRKEVHLVLQYDEKGDITVAAVAPGRFSPAEGLVSHREMVSRAEIRGDFSNVTLTFDPVTGQSQKVIVLSLTQTPASFSRTVKLMQTVLKQAGFEGGEVHAQSLGEDKPERIGRPIHISEIPLELFDDPIIRIAFATARLGYLTKKADSLLTSSHTEVNSHLNGLNSGHQVLSQVLEETKILINVLDQDVKANIRFFFSNPEEQAIYAYLVNQQAGSLRQILTQIAKDPQASLEIRSRLTSPGGLLPPLAKSLDDLRAVFGPMLDETGKGVLERLEKADTPAKKVETSKELKLRSQALSDVLSPIWKRHGWDLKVKKKIWGVSIPKERRSTPPAVVSHFTEGDLRPGEQLMLLVEKGHATDIRFGNTDFILERNETGGLELLDPKGGRRFPFMVKEGPTPGTARLQVELQRDPSDNAVFINGNDSGIKDSSASSWSFYASDFGGGFVLLARDASEDDKTRLWFRGEVASLEAPGSMERLAERKKAIEERLAQGEGIEAAKGVLTVSRLDQVVQIPYQIVELKDMGGRSEYIVVDRGTGHLLYHPTRPNIGIGLNPVSFNTYGSIVDIDRRIKKLPPFIRLAFAEFFESDRPGTGPVSARSLGAEPVVDIARISNEAVMAKDVNLGVVLGADRVVELLTPGKTKQDLAREIARVEEAAFRGRTGANPQVTDDWLKFLEKTDRRKQETFLLINGEGVVKGYLLATPNPMKRRSLINVLASDPDGVPGRGTFLMDTYITHLRNRNITDLAIQSIKDSPLFYHKYFAPKMDYETHYGTKFTAFLNTLGTLTEREKKLQADHVARLIDRKARVEGVLKGLEGDYLFKKGTVELNIAIARDGRWDLDPLSDFTRVLQEEGFREDLIAELIYEPGTQFLRTVAGKREVLLPSSGLEKVRVTVPLAFPLTARALAQALDGSEVVSKAGEVYSLVLTNPRPEDALISLKRERDGLISSSIVLLNVQKFLVDLPSINLEEISFGKKGELTDMTRQGLGSEIMKRLASVVPDRTTLRLIAGNKATREKLTTGYFIDPQAVLRQTGSNALVTEEEDTTGKISVRTVMDGTPLGHILVEGGFVVFNFEGEGSVEGLKHVLTMPRDAQGLVPNFSLTAMKPLSADGYSGRSLGGNPNVDKILSMKPDLANFPSLRASGAPDYSKEIAALDSLRSEVQDVISSRSGVNRQTRSRRDFLVNASISDLEDALKTLKSDIAGLDADLASKNTKTRSSKSSKKVTGKSLGTKDFPDIPALRQHPELGIVMDGKRFVTYFKSKDRQGVIVKAVDDLIRLEYDAFKAGSEMKRSSPIQWTENLETTPDVYILIDPSLNVTGYLVGTRYPASGGEIAYLSELTTSREGRSKGVGTLLMDAYFEGLRRDALESVAWKSTRSAVDFYGNYLSKRGIPYLYDRRETRFAINLDELHQASGQSLGVQTSIPQDLYQDLIALKASPAERSFAVTMIHADALAEGMVLRGLIDRLNANPHEIVRAMWHGDILSETEVNKVRAQIQSQVMQAPERFQIIDMRREINSEKGMQAMLEGRVMADLLLLARKLEPGIRTEQDLWPYLAVLADQAVIQALPKQHVKVVEFPAAGLPVDSGLREAARLKMIVLTSQLAALKGDWEALEKTLPNTFKRQGEFFQFTQGLLEKLAELSQSYLASLRTAAAA